MEHRTKTFCTVRAKGYHTAHCSCGWVSRDQLTKAEADTEASEHVITATRAEG